MLRAAGANSAAATLQMFILGPARTAGTESWMRLLSQVLMLALVSLQGFPQEHALCFLKCAASGVSDDIGTLSSDGESV